VWEALRTEVGEKSPTDLHMHNYFGFVLGLIGLVLSLLGYSCAPPDKRGRCRGFVIFNAVLLILNAFITFR
jgi:hypothetical protein